MSAHWEDNEQWREISSAQHLCSRYSAFSATHREIAVTSFLGANLTDSATSQFLAPEITTVRPAINPRYPSRATASALIAPIFLNSRESSIPARFAKSVSVAPGQKQLTTTPAPATSFASASENDST
jgi:hypothetical protein